MDSTTSSPLSTIADIHTFLGKFFENTEAANDFYVPILACVLSNITARTDQLPNAQQHVSVFSALKAPAISIRAYLDRLCKYAHCSPEVFIVSLVYLDRLIQRNPGFVITTLNVHRLLVTSVMVAAKFFDDVYYNNAYYARVGGVSNKEMNALELELLYLLNFDLTVTTADFARYQNDLFAHSAHVHDTMCHCHCESTVCEVGSKILFMQQQQQQYYNECGVCTASQDAIGNDIVRSGSADSVDSTSSVETCDDVIYHDDEDMSFATAASASSAAADVDGYYAPHETYGMPFAKPAIGAYAPVQFDGMAVEH